MTPTLATLLGKAITPQMVALGASAMSATPPIPIFSGSVVTSIKGAAIHDEGGAAIHDEGGLMPWIIYVFVVSVLGSPSIVTKTVYMRTSTSSPCDKIWRQREHDKTGEADKWRQQDRDSCVCRVVPKRRT